MPQPSPSTPHPSDESSVLVSLHELLDLESERLREEEAMRREEQLKAHRARLALERQKNEEEQARLIAFEEQRRAADLQRREEEARLAAIQASEMEKARMIAESQIRLRLKAQEQEHQEKLARIAENGTKRKLRLGLTLSMLAFVGLGAVSVVLLRQREAESLDEVERVRRTASDQERAFDIEIGRLEERLRLLDRADDRGRVVLQDEIEELNRQKSSQTDRRDSKNTKPPVTDPGRKNQQKRKEEPPKPSCPEGDPMCPL